MIKVHFGIFMLLTSFLCIGQSSTQYYEGFRTYEVFKDSNETISPEIKDIAKNIQPLAVNDGVLTGIQDERPDFIAFEIKHNNETLMLKMQRFETVAEDLKIRNQNDEILEYTPGLYYRGTVNNDSETIAVFNFFRQSVNGIISIPNQGNRNIGQLLNTSQYVIFSDSEMSITPDFQCDVDKIDQEIDLIPQNELLNRSSASVNCIRKFYEITNDIYLANSSSITNTMDWLTSVNNINATLYSNANIQTVLSDVLIWQTEDPYINSNGDKLNLFRNTRIAFDGDVGHLLDLPVTGGVAYLNSLCQNSRYAFSGVSMFFQQLPAYSWTVNVIAHEMGHSLGSPHTHSCFWNGNNTAIDSCGPNNDYSEGCDDGPVPLNGGTVMSYCHLDATGINLANGFHPQVGTYMSNNIDTKSCLGSDCINSCVQTIAGLSVSESETGELIVNIQDVISNAWDYRVFEVNSIPTALSTTNTNPFTVDNIQPNTYYFIDVYSICSNGNYGSFLRIPYLSDADWCSNVTFTDTGGLNGNYSDNETNIKTFYPSAPDSKIALNINQFDIEQDFDFMSIYDGESINSPVFENGLDLTGSNLDTTFFEATNPSGAITVEFTSDNVLTSPGWDITVSCITLSNLEFSEQDFSVYPNPTESLLNINSLKPLDKILIFDIQGKLIYERNLNNSLKLKVDLDEFSTGIYLMRLESKNASVIKKIVKK